MLFAWPRRGDSHARDSRLEHAIPASLAPACREIAIVAANMALLSSTPTPLLCQSDPGSGPCSVAALDSLPLTSTARRKEAPEQAHELPMGKQSQPAAAHSILVNNAVAPHRARHVFQMMSLVA